MKDDIVEIIVKLLQNSEDQLPKVEDVGQGTLKDKDSVFLDQPSINRHALRGFDSNTRSNQGWSTRGIQLPKINMRKFDSKDPIAWIFQMEWFFDIHQVPNLQKVTIAYLYLDPQQFVWYQWLCECKKNTIISWSIFTKELIAYHDDVKSNSLFTQLINLRKKGPVIKNIKQFQKLSLRVEGIPDDKLLDLFIGTLKDKIQHEVRIFEPTSLEKSFMVERKVESKNLKMVAWRTMPNNSKESNVPSTNPPQPTRLTPHQLEEIRAKGLCFNCDIKYSKGHKCGEKKLFYIDYEEEEEYG